MAGFRTCTGTIKSLSISVPSDITANRGGEPSTFETALNDETGHVIYNDYLGYDVNLCHFEKVDQLVAEMLRLHRLLLNSDYESDDDKSLFTERVARVAEQNVFSSIKCLNCY